MYTNRKFYENYVSTRDVELLHNYTLKLLSEVGDLRERATKEINDRVNSYKLPDLTKTQQTILNEYLPKEEQF